MTAVASLAQFQEKYLSRNGLLRAAGVVCSIAVPLVLLNLLSSELTSEYLVSAIHAKLLLLFVLLTAERILASHLQFEAATIYGHLWTHQ